MPSVWLKTEGTVECIAHLMKSGKWVGECEALGICIESDDLNDLNDLYGQFHEAITLLVRDLMEDGELDAFLKTMGWTADSGWLHDAAAKEDPASVVPWTMITPGQPDDAHTYEVA